MPDIHEHQSGFASERLGMTGELARQGQSTRPAPRSRITLGQRRREAPPRRA